MDDIVMRHAIPEDMADLLFKKLAVKYIQAQDKESMRNPIYSVNELRLLYDVLGSPVIKG